MSDAGETRKTLEVLKLAESYFQQKGFASPRVDAEILLSHVLQVPRFQLYMRHDQPLEKSELDGYRELIRARGQGTPVQHLTGEQEFYSLKLQVSKKALIPRPETEILVETAFTRIAPEGDPGPRHVYEIGTGSGAIAIALAKGWPNAHVLAADLSLDALEVARGNVEVHGVGKRVKPVHGDLFEPLGDDTRVDLVISNPPYIPSADIESLDAEVRAHEPRLALDGGEDGLHLLRNIVMEAPRHLTAGGYLLLEMGDTQGEAVREIALSSGHYAQIEILPDLTGRPRIVAAQTMTTQDSESATT